VLRDLTGRVLIARRAEDSHQGGLWEFPGGKLHSGESAREALARELREELGVSVLQATPLLQVRHAYADRQVLLDTWEVSRYSGEVTGREGQPLDWLTPQNLRQRRFPAADLPIIDALCLPECYAWLADSHPALLSAALAAGRRLLTVPAPAGDPRLRLCIELCAEAGAELMLRTTCPADLLPGAAGWQLAASDLPSLGRPSITRRLAARCHTLADARRALALGCYFAVLDQPFELPLPYYLDQAMTAQSARAVGARGLVERWS
jgi:8-oxo-dGTP diphosphatase